MVVSVLVPFVNLLPAVVIVMLGFCVGFMIMASLLEYVNHLFKVFGLSLTVCYAGVCLSMIHHSDVYYSIAFVTTLITSILCSMFFVYSFELIDALKKVRRC
jgi:zinc transporter ZupT